MTAQIGSLLRAVQVGRLARAGWQTLHEPERIRYRWDVEQDYWEAHQQLNSFIRQGREREKADRIALFISFTTLPVFAKFEALIAKSLQLRGFTPVILTYSKAKHARRYYDLFGLNHLVFWDKLLETQHVTEDYITLAHALIPSQLTVSGIVACRYRGVEVGKHALSRALRDRVQGSLNLSDPAQATLIRGELAKAVRYTDVANDLLDDLCPKVTFVREFGYTPYAQPFAAGLARGIPGVNWHPGQRSGSWVFKRYTSTRNPKAHLSIDDSTWRNIRNLPLDTRQDALLDNELQARYQPDSKTDTRCLQEGKRFKSKEEIQQQLGLDPEMKTAIIFSHLTWDAAFFFGEHLFNDFEHWLVETTRVAFQNKNVNWIIKLHPANMLKLRQKPGQVVQASELVALRQLGELPGHVKIMSPSVDINTWSLYSLTDYGLTVRGSIGFELPCFGIPVLTAGTGGYTGFGFTIDSQTPDEYLEHVRTIHTIPRLKQTQIVLARRHAYCLLLRRQLSLEDIAPMTHLLIRQARHPLQTNIHFRASSLRDIESAKSLSAVADWIEQEDTPDLLASHDAAPL
jgi:hypothetical protein